MGIAIVLGPLVGSFIVSVTTRRWIFYIHFPFGALAMVVLLFAVGPLRPFTKEEREDLLKWCSCVTGAITEDEYASALLETGFKEV